MKKIIAVVCAATVAVCLIFVAADLLDITRYIHLSRNYDWLAFSGAILGGLLMLLGVYFTIKKQSEADRENRRVSAMPILEYSLHYCKEDFDNSNGQLAGETIPHINIEGATYLQKESREWYYNLLVSNVGVAPAVIDKTEFVFSDNAGKKICESSVGFTYKLIRQNDCKSIKFLIYAPASRFENKDFCYSVKLTVFYRDMVGNKYTQLVRGALAADESATFADISYCEPFEQV